LISPNGVAPPSWMVGVSVSVIFHCTIKSRRYLLAPADVDGPRRSAIKRLCVFGCGFQDVSRQTDKPTERHADHNNLHSLPGLSENENNKNLKIFR